MVYEKCRRKHKKKEEKQETGKEDQEERKLKPFYLTFEQEYVNAQNIIDVEPWPYPAA